MSTNLSVHDKAVLNCIFNPSLPISEAYQEETIEELIDAEEESPELTRVQAKELEAVHASENKDYNRALELLADCLAILPEKASVYNNRAQIHQFAGNFNDALDDLSEAIRLASNKQQRKTLCNALCQRGLLHRKYNRMELARQDYEKAAEMGSKFAKTQLVEINPYAALCNQMLRKVMDDLK